MKKFLKIMAVIVLSLLIFFVGLFKYRQYSANQVLIPADANSVVKISVDEIYKSLALNMISNPGFYLNSGTGKYKKSKLEDFEHGLEIPASIYFYTIKNQPATAMFFRMKIKDNVRFDNFLKNVLQFTSQKKQNGLSYAKAKLGNVSICYNGTEFAMVLSTERSNFDPILVDILKQKNFIKLSESNFNSVKNSTEHLVFADGEHFAALNFDNGAITFNDEFFSKSIIAASKPQHRKFASESAVSFWFNANFKTASNQTFKLKNASLKRDSLLKYYTGYMDFEWMNTTQQTDSIITYDYNDDFEKVEKVTLQKRDVPNFIVNISSDAIRLKNYLTTQQIVDLDSGLVNKNVFPLYKVFVGGNDKQLLLSTSKGNNVALNTEASSDFFALNIDFRKLNKQITMPILMPYFKNLNNLKVKGKVIANGKVRVNGRLEMINEDINSLYQLLKEF